MDKTRASSIVEELLPLIERVARNVASDYPNVEWEDIRGGLCIFVMQNAGSLKTREEGGNPNYILKKVAHTLCKSERAMHMSLSPQYAYRPSDVMKILETAFSVEDIPKTHVPEDAVSMMHGTDEIEVASDIRDAYSRLKPELREAIFRRFALNEIPNNASYERKRLNKAVKELTSMVNSYKGRPEGRRRVMSNAAAHAVISNNY